MTNPKITDAQDVNGQSVQMRYTEHGRGKFRMCQWLFFRNGTKVGYAATAEDAAVNWARVQAGMSRDPESGRWGNA